MKAEDIMSRDVATARVDTSVRELAALMAQRRISGLPIVLDDGAVIGIVSESDLLHRVELGTEVQRGWWLRLFSDSDQLAREFTKAHGLTAGDIMCRSIISVADDASLAEVAAMLDRHRIKRVPVLRNGKLVGIITRGDLVRALSKVVPIQRAEPAGNGTLYKRIAARMDGARWLSASLTNVVVEGDVAQVWGIVPSAAQKAALLVLIAETPGVARVEDHLTVGVSHLSAV